jgi:hypothetical protein
MSESNKLIKNIAFDIISLTTIWGLTHISLYQNDFYIQFNLLKYFYKVNYSHIYTRFFAIGYSAILFFKYY